MVFVNQYTITGDIENNNNNNYNKNNNDSNFKWGNECSNEFQTARVKKFPLISINIHCSISFYFFMCVDFFINFFHV